MDNDNMFIYDSVRQPPPNAMKKITGGRLRGMTDINPQWRYEAATRLFGPCGHGWKFRIKRVWVERASLSDAGEGILQQAVANAIVDFQWRLPNDEWSEPIEGIGGSMFIALEKNGLYVSDEAYKMAVTDALSTCMKMLGFGADVYAGKMDGSKYQKPASPPSTGNVPTEKVVLDIVADIEAASTLDELALVWKQHSKKVATFPASAKGKIITAKERKKKELSATAEMPMEDG